MCCPPCVQSEEKSMFWGCCHPWKHTSACEMGGDFWLGINWSVVCFMEAIERLNYIFHVSAFQTVLVNLQAEQRNSSMTNRSVSCFILMRRRQGFKKEDQGNKDISGCFRTECLCPEWRAHHSRIDFLAWWLKYWSDLDISSKQVRKNIIAAMTNRWAVSRTGSQPSKGHGVMDRWMVGTYSVNLSASGTDVHFLNLIKRVYVGTPRVNKWESNASLRRSTTDMQTETARWPKVRLHGCKGKLLGCVPQIHLQHLFTGLVFCLRWSKFRQHVPPETSVFIVLLEILEWKKYSYHPRKDSRIRISVSFLKCILFFVFKTPIVTSLHTFLTKERWRVQAWRATF